MTRRVIVVLGIFVLFSAVHCSHRPPLQNVLVPPRIDLVPHERIGVIEFDANARGQLAALATRRFEEMARQDQGLVRMVDLGSSGSALGSVSERGWSPAAYRAVGTRHTVKTVFIGELTLSNVKPEISLAASLRAGQVSAHVDAQLHVQLIETESGASLWNRSASASRTVGHVSILRGAGFAFDAQNPEEAYGDLVDALVEQVTRDFRASWIRQ